MSSASKTRRDIPALTDHLKVVRSRARETLAEANPDVSASLIYFALASSWALHHGQIDGDAGSRNGFVSTWAGYAAEELARYKTSKPVAFRSKRGGKIHIGWLYPGIDLVVASCGCGKSKHDVNDVEILGDGWSMATCKRAITLASWAYNQ